MPSAAEIYLESTRKQQKEAAHKQTVARQEIPATSSHSSAEDTAARAGRDKQARQVAAAFDVKHQLESFKKVLPNTKVTGLTPTMYTLEWGTKDQEVFVFIEPEKGAVEIRGNAIASHENLITNSDEFKQELAKKVERTKPVDKGGNPSGPPSQGNY